MSRLSTSLLALLLGAAAMVGLSSCGGGDTSGLLPGATASEINSNLDRVQQLVAEGDCSGALGASEEVNGQIESLEGVDSRLKEALSEGATRLAEVVSTCEEAPSEEEDEELAAQEAEEELRAEEEADEKKEKKEKPDKQNPGKDQEKEKEPPVEPPEPPGQEKKEEVTPPEEEDGGTPSGGVGPAAPAGGE